MTFWYHYKYQMVIEFTYNIEVLTRGFNHFITSIESVRIWPVVLSTRWRYRTNKVLLPYGDVNTEYHYCPFYCWIFIAFDYGEFREFYYSLVMYCTL